MCVYIGLKIHPKPTDASSLEMTPLAKMISTILILLLTSSVSYTSAGSWPFPVPGTCKLSLELLDPCFPLYPLNPTPACCQAAAPLADAMAQFNLCHCLKDLQLYGALNITPLPVLFHSCHLSVKVPPIPIPEDIDCADYAFEGETTMRCYWTLVEDLETGTTHWEMRTRFPISTNSSAAE